MKKVSYWYAIFTHILTTGLVAAILMIGVVFLTLYIASVFINSSLLPIITTVVLFALYAAVIYVSTWNSARFIKKRYAFDEVSNFMNFSSILAAVILLLVYGVSIQGLAMTAIGTIGFYLVTNRTMKAMQSPAPAQI